MPLGCPKDGPGRRKICRAGFALRGSAQRVGRGSVNCGLWDGSEIRNRYGPTCHLPVHSRLDDLSAERETIFGHEKLYQILDYRTVERLPTVVTINLSPEEWTEKLGARIADRLGNRRLVKVVENAAASYRRGPPA